MWVEDITKPSCITRRKRAWEYSLYVFESSASNEPGYYANNNDATDRGEVSLRRCSKSLATLNTCLETKYHLSEDVEGTHQHCSIVSKGKS